MMRRALLPLTAIYAAGVALKNAAFDHGWAKAQKLRWPVISVGNISVGGSGKTPFVICLAKLLQRHGVSVDVLSRGYGRSSDAVELVDPAGDAERYGDEPLLITQSTDAAVYVGASRYAAGALAESNHGAEGVHILDDGFQHRKLARAVDIVLLHRSDFEEMLLPAGRLREQIGSLERASILVLREEDGYLERKLEEHGIEKPIWWIQRSIIVPDNLTQVVVFCGIVRPDEFFRMLEKHGVGVVARRAFRDHHPYSDDDVRQLIEEARIRSANAFLTTEKDFVRLSPKQKEIFASAGDLQAAKLEVQLCDEAGALDDLKRLLPSSFACLL
jgi:tetraacyldisaccharide 4'-kinase